MNKTLPITVLHVNCDICGFTFHSKEYLKLHLTKWDSTNNILMMLVLHVNCAVCGLTYYSKDHTKLPK